MYLRLRLLVITIMLANLAYSQQTKSSYLYNYVTETRQLNKQVFSVSLFEKSDMATPADIQNILTQQQFLTLQKVKSRSLYQSRPFNLSFFIPYNNQSFQLELVKEDISSKGFLPAKSTGKGTTEKVIVAEALHYRGYVKNYPSSIASLSVFENGEIMCLFSNEDGNYNLGKTINEKYILYNSNNMTANLGFECSTNEMPEIPTTTESINNQVFQPLAGEVCNKVNIYWEANYKLYNERFANNFTNTLNYLTGVFNQMATLYHNDKIIVELSEVFIWTTPDTFTTTSSATGLTAIRNKWNSLGNSFNGDLCMLVDGGTTNNGGRAYLLRNGICSRSVAYGYSNVRGTYSNVPTYSWDVEVLTHETGHNMGSNHTQWCGWNTGAGGTCGAIDDCVTVETTSSCSTCGATTLTNPTPPVGFKGTIMSYCHLRSGIGINLALGFGPLPKAFIQSNIGASSCLIKHNTWTGSVDTTWENPANWSCGSIPTATTDVTIPTGLANYPVIKSSAVCRRLNQQQGSRVKVNSAFKLDVVGH